MNQYYAVVDLRSEGNTALLSIIKPSLDAIPGTAYTVVIYTHILSNMGERRMDYIFNVNNLSPTGQDHKKKQ